MEAKSLRGWSSFWPTLWKGGGTETGGKRVKRWEERFLTEPLDSAMPDMCSGEKQNQRDKKRLYIARRLRGGQGWPL